MSTPASDKTTTFDRLLKEQEEDVKRTLEKGVFIHHGSTILHECLC
jgi:hypothetical protein